MTKEKKEEIEKLIVDAGFGEYLKEMCFLSNVIYNGKDFVIDFHDTELFHDVEIHL